LLCDHVNESLTIGEAFDGYKYFNDISWKEIKDDRGRNIVEFKGTIDLPKCIAQHTYSTASPSIIKEAIRNAPKELFLNFEFLINRGETSFTFGKAWFSSPGQDDDVISSSYIPYSELEQLYAGTSLYKCGYYVEEVERQKRLQEEEEQKRLREEERQKEIHKDEELQKRLRVEEMQKEIHKENDETNTQAGGALPSQ